MAAETRIGPAGWVLATNIKRVREAQRLSYAELARMLKDKAGQRIPVLGLRKIESMERRVDFDELLVLAYVLEVCPVDLMVSKDATDEPYAVTRSTSSRRRAYGSGSGVSQCAWCGLSSSSPSSRTCHCSQTLQSRCSMPSNGCPKSGPDGSAADSSQIRRTRHEHSQH
jgi:hypothetical protein